MDANVADKVVKRKRPRSNTVVFARGITREKDYYKRGTDERRTKSASSAVIDDFSSEDYGLYFTRTFPSSLRTIQRSSNSTSRGYPFGSLKIIKQKRDSALKSLFNQDGRLKDDTELGYDYRRKSSTISNDSTDGDLSVCSTEDPVSDVSSRDGECDTGSFTAEDVIHLENSIRISQLRAEKKVSFYAEELLHDAIQRDDIDELCDLLDKNKELNLDLEKPNNFGITPLHRAAIDGGYRCLTFLLSRNVNVKVRDLYGWTPLHDAVYHGHIRCAAALITAGADVEAETNDFIKPIEMAADDEMLLLVGRAMTSPGYVYDQDRETLV